MNCKGFNVSHAAAGQRTQFKSGQGCSFQHAHAESVLFGRSGQSEVLPWPVPCSVGSRGWALPSTPLARPRMLDSNGIVAADDDRRATGPDKGMDGQQAGRRLPHQPGMIYRIAELVIK